MCTGTAEKAKKWFSRSLSRRSLWHQKYSKGSYIKVHYGKEDNEKIENIMDLKDFTDLKWAMKAFLDRFLYLTIK